MVYEWLKPAGYYDFKLPIKLQFDQIIESERSRDSNYKKNHKNFIIAAFCNTENSSLNMVCLEVANAMKKFVY